MSSHVSDIHSRLTVSVNFSWYLYKGAREQTVLPPTGTQQGRILVPWLRFLVWRNAVVPRVFSFRLSHIRHDSVNYVRQDQKERIETSLRTFILSCYFKRCKLIFFIILFNCFWSISELFSFQYRIQIVIYLKYDHFEVSH